MLAAQRFALPAADSSGRVICKKVTSQGNYRMRTRAGGGQVHAVLGRLSVKYR
jgi:hypothetical protein